MNAPLYKFLLFLASFGLAIARSTGRDPRNIAQLSSEVERYELLLFKATKSLFDEGELQ